MRTRFASAVATSFAVLVVSGCSDATAPEDLTEFLLDFCAGDVPAFFAVQTDAGGAWQTVPSDAAGTFAFETDADRLGIAFVNVSGTSEYTTQVIYASVAELEPISGVACPDDFGSKTVNGSVTSLPAGSQAWISMAGSTDDVLPPSTTFSLAGLPNGALDLIAHRDVFTLAGAIPNRVIVRRGLNLTNNATVTPALDFGSSTEGAAPASNTATISGMSANDDNLLFVDFNSFTTSHALFETAGFTGSSQTIYGIPSSLTQSGDLHVLELITSDVNGDAYRGVQQYYRNPADKTLPLGAPLNSPTVSTLATSPYLRHRVLLPFQAEYGSAANAQFSQDDQSASRFLSISVTTGYAGGTGTTWDIQTPNLSGVAGFPSASALQPGGATIEWDVAAYGGTVSEIISETATDGSMIKYAARTSTTPAALRAGSSVRAPRTATRLNGALGVQR